MKTAVAVTQGPLEVNHANVEAVRLLGQGRAPEADLLLQKVLKLDPENVYTLNNMGVAKEMEGEAQDALTYFDQASRQQFDATAVVTRNQAWRGRQVNEMAQQNANSLRAEFGQLQYFNATPEEFRAAFRATDALTYQIEMLADSTDPNDIQARQALEARLQNALKTALGAKRFEEFQMLHDPLYREAVAAAYAAGTPEAARTIYQVNLAALGTQDEIQSNSQLTDSQKAVELKQVELDQLKANTLATGQQLPPDPPQVPARRTYTLRTGDTPAVIGMIYGVPESAIRAANPNVDFSRLRPGDAINLPRAALNPTPVSRTPYGP